MQTMHHLKSFRFLNLALYAIFSFQGSMAAKTDGGRLPMPDEQRLIGKLFRNYDNNVRPVYNSSHNVKVNFGLTLIQIMNMDEKNQVLVTNVWLEHEWLDESLIWDPKDYNGLEMIRIPASRLWLPDIVLYNNADDFTTGYMRANAMVSSEGQVFWSPPARLLSSCKVDITYFPFDEQICPLKFGSWTYDKAQVDISNKSAEVVMSNYVSNGEWALRRTIIQRNEVVYPISPAIYPDVTVSFVMHRRILYYILNIILPCVWLNMLSLLSFCLPPDAGEKITLGITVLLSYSVFMLLVAENMPQTSEYVPLIGIYLTLSMAMTSISVILTVCVLKLHHCGPEQVPVPKWLRHLVVGGLARILRCQCTGGSGEHNKKKYDKAGERLASIESSDICMKLMSEMNDRFPHMNDSKSNYNTAIRDDFPGSNTPLPVVNTIGQVNHESCSYQPRSKINQSLNRFNSSNYQTRRIDGARIQTTVRPTMLSSPTSSTTTYEEERLSILGDILRHIKLIVQKKEEEEAETSVVDEWRLVAQITDRFLFWLFLLITTFATMLIIVIIPLVEYMRKAY